MGICFHTAYSWHATGSGPTGHRQPAEASLLEARMNTWEEEMGGVSMVTGPKGPNSAWPPPPRPLRLQPHNLKAPLVYQLTDRPKKKRLLG